MESSQKQPARNSGFLIERLDMSGIAIPVDTESTAARRDLDKLNVSLKQLAAQSKQTSDATANSFSKVSFQKPIQESDSLRNSIKSIDTTSQQALAQIKRGGETAAVAINKMAIAAKTAATAFLAIKGVGIFNELSDSLIRYENQLRRVSENTDDMIQRQKDLFNISRQTSSEYGASIAIYTKFAKALDNTGTSLEELNTLTSTVQKTVAIAGGMTDSTRAAIMQFGQALSSGILRGEEFNSIAEQLPSLMDAIAKGMGKSTGELRSLAADGALDVNTVKNAIIRASKEVDAEFSKSQKTAAQGLSLLKDSITISIGQIAQFTGSSQRFYDATSAIADGITNMSAKAVPFLMNTSNAFSNFVYELENYSARYMAYKQFFTGDIEFGQIKMKKTEFEAFQYLLKSYDKIIGYSDRVKASITAAFSGNGPGAFLSKIENVYYTASSIAYAFTGLFDKFGKLVPIIKLPVLTFESEISRSLSLGYALLKAYAGKMRAEWKYTGEGFSEYVTLFLTGDRELERAWVRVFKSDSVKALADNFRSLGDSLRNTRFSDWSIIFNDAIYSAKKMYYSFEDVLIALEIIENRALVIDGIRFDRVISGLRTFQSIASRVFESVIAPQLKVSFAYVKFAADGALQGIVDFFEDQYGDQIAAGLGKSFGSGLSKLIIYSKDKVKELFQVFFKTGSKLDFSQIFTISVDRLKAIIRPVIDFFNSFFTTLFDGAGDASVKFFKDMVSGISRQADRLLGEVGAKVEKFTDRVKDAFFDAYDAVVGHSYWPDLVDEVNAYTSNLAESDTFIGKFTSSVTTQFKKAFEGVKAFFDGKPLQIGQVTIATSGIDFGEIPDQIRRMFASVVVGGLLFAFGGPTAKLFITDYLVSSITNILSDSVGFASSGFFKSLANLVGDGVGTIAAGIASGIGHMTDTIVMAAPAFLSSFAAAFGGIGEYVAGIFDSLPSSGLIAAALVGSAGVLVLPGNKDLKSQIGSFWEGVMSFVNSLAKGNNTVGSAIVGSKAALVTSLAVFASATLNSVSALEAALIGTPILLSAFLGADGTGRLVRDALTNFVPKAGGIILDGVTRINSSLRGKYAWYEQLVPDFTSFNNSIKSGFASSSTATAVSGKRSLREAFMDVVNAIPKMLDNMVANKKLYAEGKISFADLFLDSSNGAADLKKALKTAETEAASARRTAAAAETAYRRASASALSTIRDIQTAAIVTPSMLQARQARIAAARAAAVHADATRQAADAANAAADAARDALRKASARIDAKSIFGNFASEILGYLQNSPVIQSVAGFFSNIWKSIVTSYNSGAIQSVITNTLTLFSGLSTGISDVLKSIPQNARGIWTEVSSVFTTLGGAFSAVIEKFRAWRVALLAESAAGGAQGILSRILYGATGRAGFLALLTGTLSFFSFKAFAGETNAATGVVMGLGAAALTAAASLYTAALAMRAFKAYTTGGLAGLIEFKNVVVTNWAGSFIKAFSVIKTSLNDFWKLLLSINATTITATFSFSNFIKLGTALAAISKELLAIKAAVLAIAAAGKADGIRGIISLLSEAVATNSGKALEGLKALYAFATRAWLAVARFIGSISALSTTALVALAVTVGVVGLFLFGPEGSLMKKLNYYYDVIRSYFSDVEALYPRQKDLMLAIPDREVAGREVNFSAKINKIDTDAMSAKDFAGLLNTVKITNETLDRYADITKKQGSLNAEQSKSLQKVIDQQDQVFSKAPRIKSIDDLSKGSEALQAEILSYSTTFTDAFDRLNNAAAESLNDAYNTKGYQTATQNILNAYGLLVVGYRSISESVSTAATYVSNVARSGLDAFIAWWNDSSIFDPITKAMGGVMATVKSALGPMSDSVGMVFTDVFDKLFNWDKVAADFREIFGPASIKEDRKLAAEDVQVRVQKISDNEGLFTKPEMKKYTDSINAYREAQKQVDSAIANNVPQASEEFKKLSGSLDLARANFERLSDSMAKSADIRQQAKIYKENWEQVWQSVKETFGSDIGKELGMDLLFDTDTFKDGIIDAYGLAVQKGKEATDILKGKVFGDNNAIIDTTVALKYKLDRASAQKAMAEMEETAKQLAFFDTQIEFAIQVTGADVAKEDVQDLFRTNQEGFFDWMEKAKELRRWESQLSQLSLANPKDVETFEANKTKIKEILEMLPRLRKAAQDAAPKKGLFEDFNAKLTKIGVENVELKPFSAMSKDLYDKVIPAINRAEEAKKKLDEAKNKPFEEYIAALREMLGQANAVRNVIKGLKPPEVQAAEALGTNSTEVYALGGKRKQRALDLGAQLAKDRNNLEDPNFGGDKQALAKRILSGERSASKMFEKAADDIFSRFSDAMQKKGVQIDLAEYVRFESKDRFEAKGIIEQMGVIRAKLNNAGGIYPSNEEWFHNQQLAFDKLQKKLDEFKERAKSSFGGMIEKIASSGFDINLDSAFGISDETINNLFDIAKQIDEITKSLNDPAFKGNPRQLIANLANLRKQQKDVKLANSNFGDRFSVIKEQLSGLDINEEDFTALPKNIQQTIYRDAMRLAAATEAAAKVVGEAAVEAQAKLLKDRKDASKTASSAVTEALPGRYTTQASAINTFAGDFKLSDTDFAKLSTEQRDELFKFANTLKNGAKELETATGEAATAAARGFEEAKKKFEASVQGAITTKRSSSENLVSEANVAGLSVDRASVNLLSEAQIKMFRDAAQLIREKQKLANETADANIRQMAQAEVWNLRDKFEGAFKTLAVKPSETPMALQAKAFASGVISSVESSIIDVLKGKMSVKDGIAGILDTFTSSIIDSFVKGLTQPFTGEQGLVTQFMRNIGGNIFGLGSQTASMIPGSESAPGLESAPSAALSSEEGNTGILENISSTLSGGFAGLTGFFAPLITTFSTMLGFDTVGVSVEQAQLIYLGSLGITIPAAIELAAVATIAAITTSSAAIVGAVAASGAASGGVGVLAGFFAEGGRIVGPGTGTSDSITAMVSNGEYIINAKATKANLPLLEAINSGKLPRFADGGLVGQSLIAVPAYVPVEQPASGSQSVQTFNIQITGDISRQTKSEIYKMLPSIAAGVNQHNREKGR